MEQEKTPVLSVLMTAFNREAFIAAAIESVLKSEFTDFELIIVDDGSQDATVSIARSYADTDNRVKLYVNEKNKGDYPNRNIAASYARGKYIKFLDSDDTISAGGLGRMVAVMESFPEAGFAFGDCKPVANSSYPVVYTGEEALRIHFMKGGLLQAGPSTTIIRSAAFKELGGFGHQRYVSDYKAWLHLCLRHSVAVFEPGLVWIRSHQGQEMDLGKLSYYSMNYNLHRDFLLNSPHPFSETETKKLLYNYRVLLGRRVYQRLLKWFGLKKTMETIKAAGENRWIFLWAFFPMKRFNNERY